MRPKKLYSVEQEQLLVIIYNKVRTELKKEKNCNQFYIANHLKKLFSLEIDWDSLSGGKQDTWYEHPKMYREERRAARLKAGTIREGHEEKLALYFEADKNEISNISDYIGVATPAAIVQMVKRIKKQVQN